MRIIYISIVAFTLLSCSFNSTSTIVVNNENIKLRELNYLNFFDSLKLHYFNNNEVNQSINIDLLSVDSSLFVLSDFKLTKNVYILENRIDKNKSFILGSLDADSLNKFDPSFVSVSSNLIYVSSIPNKVHFFSRPEYKYLKTIEFPFDINVFIPIERNLFLLEIIRLEKNSNQVNLFNEVVVYDLEKNKILFSVTKNIIGDKKNRRYVNSFYKDKKSIYFYNYFEKALFEVNKDGVHRILNFDYVNEKDYTFYNFLNISETDIFFQMYFKGVLTIYNYSLKSRVLSKIIFKNFPLKIKHAFQFSNFNSCFNIYSKNSFEKLYLSHSFNNDSLRYKNSFYLIEFPKSKNFLKDNDK